MQPNRPLVIALMGPTASGKTELAIDIAKKINSNIHNIDSRQIYIDMDIGTAKPTGVQQSQVNHFLIDVCLPSKPINLHDFQSIAKTSIEKDLEKKGLTLLGSIMVAFAHYRNHQICRKLECNNCHE